jgi:hypothetical protein
MSKPEPASLPHVDVDFASMTPPAAEPMPAYIPTPAPAPTPTPSPSAALSASAAKPSEHLQFYDHSFDPEPVSHPAIEPPAPRYRAPEPAFAPRQDEAPVHPLSAHHAKEPTDMPSPARKSGGNRSRIAVAAILLILVVGGGTLAARKFFTTAVATTGTVVITTNPPGAEIFLDGHAQGVSPNRLTVAPGTHVLELRGGGEPRSIAIDVTAGAQLSQYIELGAAPKSVGSLQVRTEPAGAKVSVDGVARGSSPVIVNDLAAGEHSVVVDTEAGTTRQTVVVEAGAMASLLAQLPSQTGPASGWINVNTPKTVQLFEEGRLLGSSDSERLMVSAGTHRLEIINEALGYRDNRTVTVAAGKTSSLNIDFPKGTIALNALPWADVWIDGEKVGETPIGNLPITIGAHEIIFRHPELGEQRHVTTVTLNGPARLSVDMRKRP